MAYPGCASAWTGTGSTEGSWERSRSFLPRPPLDKQENTSVTLFPPTKNCHGHGIIAMITLVWYENVSSGRPWYQFIFLPVWGTPAFSQPHLANPVPLKKPRLTGREKKSGEKKELGWPYRQIKQGLGYQQAAEPKRLFLKESDVYFKH